MKIDSSSFCKELTDMIPTLKIIDFIEYNNNYMNPPPDDIFFKIRKDYMQFVVGIPTLEHEIAHMVEMKDFSRCIINDWGLRFDIENISNKLFFLTMAREARVRGIQSHLDGREYAYSANHPVILFDAPGHLPFGKFNSCKDFYDWMQAIFSRSRSDWSKDRIYDEWVKRAEYIRNWQETK